MPLLSLAQLVEAVAAGQLVSFPTDTVPALAAQPQWGHQIYQAKQRTPDKPLILMAATAADLWPFTAGTAAEQQQWAEMAAQGWPGALTLVLPASDRVPQAINPMQTGTVGLRVPAHPLARRILAQTGPLATTSANRSGQPPLTDMAAIAAQFPQVVIWAEAEADPGLASGQPSTVMRWTGQGWETLRQGQPRPLGRNSPG